MGTLPAVAIATTRLVILGGVRTLQPVHGYLLRRELSSWHAERWAHLKPGSVYNALRSLTREGFLAEVDAGGSGDGGGGGAGDAARTRYRLTRRGEREFFRLLHEALRTVDPAAGDVGAAGWSFAWTLPRAEVVDALEERLETIETQRSTLAATARAAAADERVPEHVVELARLLRSRLDGERAWLRSLLPRLHAGEYRFADDE